MASVNTGRLGRSTELALSVLLVASLLLLGFVQGLNQIAFETSLAFISLNVAFIEALSSVLGFSLFVLVCTALSFTQIFRQGRSVEDAEDYRSITAIIPTYNDSHSLEKSVPSLVGLDNRDLEIMIVYEEDDEEAREKCESLAERYDSVEYTVNDVSPGTKAGALNCGVEKTDSEAVFFFDADQEVKPGFISKSMNLLFKEGYDVIQGRIVPRPSGLLETICYCEALFMYVIPERIADFLTDYKVAGSRGTGMSRETYEKMDGYDPEFLTEDLDFAFRCYERGLKVKPLLSEVCTEEAPHSLRDYWGQRKRWVKGHIEVFTSRLSYLWKDPSIAHFKSAIMSGFIPVGWFLLILLVSKFLILMLLGQDLIVAGALGNLIAISLLFRIEDRKYLEPGNYTSYVYLIGAPLVFPLYGVVSIKSLFEYIIRGENSWYMVEKKSS